MYIDIHTHKNCREGSLYIKNIVPDDVVKMNNMQDGYFSTGLHPWFIGNLAETDKQLQKINEIVHHKNLLAIGEAGLDGTIDTDMKVQREVFIAQIQISEKFAKPMIVHCVKAYTDILMIKKKQKVDMPWIVHGFNSSIEMAKQLIINNCILSFGKNLFNSNSKARYVFEKISHGKFFLETDDHEYTIDEIYERAAGIKKISIGNLKSLQLQSFEKVFGFNPVN